MSLSLVIPANSFFKSNLSKTESAVRITHIPTGVVAQCQNGHSQHENKDEALKYLKDVYIKLNWKKKEQKMAEEYVKKCGIGWGSQIRLYVMPTEPENLPDK